MRRAVIVLALAAVLALPSAGATGFDFTSGRSFAQAPGDGGANTFTIPFHANADGFVYLKMLATPANAVNNGGPAANGSAAQKTGWWIEWAVTRNGATQELGARDDGTPTALVAVKAGEDDAVILRVHWPAAANTAGAADLVYGALAFRLDTSGTAPGSSSGAQMDEARSFHVEIDMTGGTTPLVPPTSAPPPSGTPTPPSTATGSSPTPSAPSNSASPQSPTPPVSGINTGGSTSTGGGNGGTVQIVTQEARLPTWVVPMLVGEGVLVALLAVVAIVVLLRPQRIEVIVRNEAGSVPLTVSEPPRALPAEPMRVIKVEEK